MTSDLEALYPFLGRPADGGSALLDGLIASARAKIVELAALLDRCDEMFSERIAACAGEIAERIERGGRLYAFGNGGSATDAAALAGSSETETPLPAVSLAADVATITALANDVSFDVVFARPIAAFARAEDIACGLSTSGNSRNVIAAFEAAAARGMLTVGFAGYDGGAMIRCDVIDHLFVVPSTSVHRIQEAQTALYHDLLEQTRRRLGARSLS